MTQAQENMSAKSANISPHFVRGLDSFRFIAATVVAAGHGAWIPFNKLFGETHRPIKLLAGIWDSVPNGILAVSVFFFISGFCIHYPNIGKSNLPIGSFLIKRFFRIGIPLLVIIAAAHASGPQYVGALDSVLWSVYCELAYYALYPFLFPMLRGRLQYASALSGCISITLLVAYPQTARPMNFGAFTFLFCAPMWLLGAVLAERYRSGAIFTERLPSVWLLRSTLPICAVLSIFLFYHAPIQVPLTWSVVAFVPIGYIWLKKELQRLTSHRTTGILEHFGKASYSMYLVHRFPLTFFSTHLIFKSPFAVYSLQAAAIAISTYGFFKLIEEPSHSLAKRLGRTWDSALIGGVARAQERHLP